jgi:hypothetical protein
MTKYIDNNGSADRRAPNVRADRLRARGLIMARQRLVHSLEAVRRARVAYARLRIAPDYRKSVRRRLAGQSKTLRARLWSAIVVAVAVLGVLGVAFGPYVAVGIGIAAFVLATVFMLARVQEPEATSQMTPADVGLEFDSFFASRALRLPDESREALRRLGEDLSILLSDILQADADPVLIADDARFLRGIVSEHLVNAIDPYLALRRPSAIQTRLMSQQIDRIHCEVCALLEKFESVRALRLARSATFLERKLGS